MKKLISRALSMVILSVVGILGLSVGVYAAEARYEKVMLNPVRFSQTDARSELDMINELRTGKDAWYWNEDGTRYECEDLDELIYDYDLEEIAMVRCVELALNMSHTRPNGKDCFSYYDEREYVYIAVGENIAAGQTSAREAFEDWCETDMDYAGQGHRRNMLSAAYNRVAMAGCYYNDCWYWVQEFAYSDNESEYVEPLDSNIFCQVEVNISEMVQEVYVQGVNNLRVNVGEYIQLHDMQILAQLPDTWPSPCPVECDVDFDIEGCEEDGYLEVELNGMKFYGRKPGWGSIFFDALGQSFEIDIQVVGNAPLPEPKPGKVDTCKVTSYKNGMKGLVVNWEPVKNIDGYHIVRYIMDSKGNEYDELIDTVDAKATSYTDKKAPNGSVIMLAVFPYKKDVLGECQTGYTIYIKRVTMSSVENCKEGIQVTWKANKYVDGYYLYRSVNGGKFKKCGTYYDTTSVVDTDVEQFADVRYKVIGFIQLDRNTIFKSYGSKVMGEICLKAPGMSVSSKQARVLTVKWQRNTGHTRYEIRYSKYSDFETAKVVSVKNTKTTLKNIKGPVRNRRYYVQMRSVYTVDGVDHYSAWGDTKSVKIHQ